jgi:TolB-like protein
MGDRVKSAWEELRRRRVVSTAAAYLAVAFVVLQLAEILFPAFNLGPGALRALFALLIASFPILIALSWIYDVTSAGLRRTDDEPESSGPHPALLAGVAASALALGVAGWIAVRTVDPGAVVSMRAASIAVLPFADMSAEGDQAYLGDGVAEEILNILAGVDGLQVAARTSSFAFRENDDIREIANRLDVAHVLEGSVRRADGDVRVTAQLIDASTGFHLWSETYDRELDDLFAVQDEIAASIAEALLGELDLEPTSAERYAASPAAQDLYYRGRAQWSRRDAVGIPGAIELFNRAIEEDSMYAEAYAGLADSWALMPQLVPSVDAEDAMIRAEALARRALELNDDLAEAHASLGLVRALRQDRVGALAELGRAVDLNGSYAPALHWRANVLADMGRLRDATLDAERAASVDPLSPAIASDYGYILLWSGDLERAAAQFQRAQSLEFGFAAALLGSALVALQQEQEVALQMALTQWTAVSSLPVSLAGQLATGMLDHRRTGEPQPVPAGLADIGRSGRLTAGTTAALHALLGSDAEALRWLRAAVDDRSWVDQYLRVNWAFDGLRGEPSFEDILDEVGA